ncbi:MAG: hypothetical protein H5U21_05100 [Porphyrobacter sp.]|nr:hypothetical protein [Porphyrobacter sp.]
MRQIGEEQALARAAAMLESEPAPPPDPVPAATSPSIASAVPERADCSGRPAN